MKTLYYHSGFQAPVVHWKRAWEADYQVVAMRNAGAGRTSHERLWQVDFASSSDETLQFFIRDEAGRDPANRFYEIRTSNAFLQDGQIFAYRPAASVDSPRRAYDPASPPSIFSKFLGEMRSFRVYLPRGYRQHSGRRYPVLYVQDGQNIFDQGPFGSWGAQNALDRLTARGQIQETIVVAVDSGANRFADYVPSEDGGRAQDYARFLTQELKAWIDRNYRTRSGAADTAIMGSSLGAVTALYVAWDYFHIVGKVAALSGSWWLKGFQNRIASQRKRPIRCYLDSGASGPYRDGIHHFVKLREQMRQMGFQEGQEMLDVVEESHQHTESAWGKRLPHALRFLFPLRECEEEMLDLPIAYRHAA